MAADHSLRLYDQEARALLTPDLGEQCAEEAISCTELRLRVAALIEGQLLPEGEILQS